MRIDTNDLLQSILDSLSRIEYCSPEKMPNIELYMDQVTTFMEEALEPTKRYPDDKILTKTMINNYAKNHLLPPPEKKKYSKEHLLTLFFIYYFKNILSISDLEKIIRPLTAYCFQGEEGRNMEAIYKEVFRLEPGEVDHLTEDLTRIYESSANTFLDASEEEKKYLQIFSFLCILSYDVFVKKLLIEKIIDGMIDDIGDLSIFEDGKKKNSKKKESKEKESDKEQEKEKN